MSLGVCAGPIRVRVPLETPGSLSEGLAPPPMSRDGGCRRARLGEPREYSRAAQCAAGLAVTDGGVMPGVSRKTAERPESLTRRLGLRLAVGVITIALSIGTAEILLRVVYGDVARITGATEWETARWKALTYAWDVYHPRFG